MKSQSLRARMNAANKESYKAAQKLDTVGMSVSVRKDDDTSIVTTLAALPWSLGHGGWVAKVVGISGGYDCARITPVVERKAA